MQYNWKDIKTMEDVYRVMGVDKKVKGDLAPVPKSLQPWVKHAAILATIVAAINPGFVPDWDNTNQKKWWGWFWLNKPGFRFDGSYYGHAAITLTTCGSRLCCETREQFEHIVKHFLPQLKAFYVG